MSRAYDNYKLWEPQPDPATIKPCPICGTSGEVWQYADKPDSQLLRVVMCKNGESFGPQIKDGHVILGGCLLYMPPNDFYRATTKEAVKYWNDYAEALLKMRKSNQGERR